MHIKTASTGNNCISNFGTSFLKGKIKNKKI